MRKNDGVVLLLMIFLMIFAGMVAVTAFSLIGIRRQANEMELFSLRARGIALAGRNWYLKQLKDDPDWSDRRGTHGVNFAGGSFDIYPTDMSASEISFYVRSKIRSPQGYMLYSVIRSSARRTPAMGMFALFYANGSGRSSVSLSNDSGHTVITGDVFLNSNLNIYSPSEILQGNIYMPEDMSVTSDKTQDVINLEDPLPEMPSIATNLYQSFITNSEDLIGSGEINNYKFHDNVVLTEDVDWTDTVIEAKKIETNGYNITGKNFNVRCENMSLEKGSRITQASGFNISVEKSLDITEGSGMEGDNFSVFSGSIELSDADISGRHFKIWAGTEISTEGDVTVTGSGTVIASDEGVLMLHSGSKNSGTLSILSDENGSISLLSGRSITVGSAKSEADISISGNIMIFSDSKRDNYGIKIAGSRTVIEGALIAGFNLLDISDQARCSNSIIYVEPYLAKRSINNCVSISGDGTFFQGAVISLGVSDPSVLIDNGAIVRGIVYQNRAFSDGGSLSIKGDSIVQGTVIADSIYDDVIGPAAIIYNQEYVGLSPLTGLEDTVYIVPGSYDDH